MKKIFIAALATAVALTVTGCKGTNEKRGDEHLKEGRFRNAINSYIEAKKKGKMSDEFFDNFTLALVRAGDMESKKDLTATLSTTTLTRLQPISRMSRKTLLLKNT